MQPKDENGKPIGALTTDTAPLEEASPLTLDADSSTFAVDSGESINAGTLAPVLDSVESIPIEISVGIKTSITTQQHIDINI